VRVIVPWPAGGGADIVARGVTQKLTEHFNQSFVVENRPGASGSLGTEVASKQAPDGYTLLLIGANHATNSHLYPKLGFDPIRDFEPISLLTEAHNLLVAHPSVSARSVSEVIALARARPGQISYGSAGNGTTGHLAMELLKQSAKIDMVHIPYKGGAPFVNDLLGGQVSLGFENVLSSSPHVATGKLRAIATSGRQRSRALPEVPTVAESGLPGFEVVLWQGLLAPAGTPRAIIEKLHEGVVASMAKPDLRERFAQLNVEPVGGTPAQFGAYLQSEYDKWGKVIRAAGISMN
jgi:tripartite-type tricarboxylate transporter receptor subunit TctC